MVRSMAKGRKTGGRDIQKGHKPDMFRKRQTEQQVSKEVKKLTGAQVEELASMLLSNNMAAIKAVHIDETATVLQRWMASCIDLGYRTASIYILERILDRIIGKVKQQVELSNAEPWVFTSTDGRKCTMGVKS